MISLVLDSDWASSAINFWLGLRLFFLSPNRRQQEERRKSFCSLIVTKKEEKMSELKFPDQGSIESALAEVRNANSAVDW